MSFWQGQRVLVSGCSGLIGAPLCRDLLEQGAEVTGYDVDTKGILDRYGLWGQFNVTLGDILDLPKLIRATSHKDVVIHLAALSHVEKTRAAGIKAFEVNVQGTWNVLEACRMILHADPQKRPDAVVVASSNHIYGPQSTIPTREDAPLCQLDTYSATKTMADYAARAYAHNYDVPTAIIRNTNCFSPYDPHDDHIVPGTILSVLKGEQPVIRSKGLTKKSYLYVDDVVTAYLKVAEWVSTTQNHGLAFNVASEPVSVLNLVGTILNVMHSTLQPKVLGQANDQADEYLDSTRVRTLTGWTPRYTLAKGIELTVTGFKERISAKA